LCDVQPGAGGQPPAKKVKREKAPVGVGVLGGRKKGATKLAKGASSLINKWQAVQQVRRVGASSARLQ